MIRLVKFALGEAKVRVLSKIRLQTGIVYHVEDIDTGHQDFVDIEYLKTFPYITSNKRVKNAQR